MTFRENEVNKTTCFVHQNESVLKEDVILELVIKLAQFVYTFLHPLSVISKEKENLQYFA